VLTTLLRREPSVRSGKAGSRNLVARVLGAYFLQNVNGGIREIALPLLIFGATGSLTSAALAALSSQVPFVLVGIFGSPQVDRLDRQKIIVISNAIRACLYLALPTAFAWWGLAPVMAIAFVSACLGAVEGPAMRATLPVLFGDRYQKFISHRTSLGSVAQIISSLLGGALVAFIGGSATIRLSGIVFGVYALLIGSIKGFDPTYQTRSLTAKADAPITYLLEGFRFVARTPVLKAFFLYWLFALAAVPLGVSAALPYLTKVRGASSLQFGLISSLYGAGVAVGAFIAGKLKFPGGAQRWLVLAGLVYGLVNLVMFLSPGLVLFGLLWFIWGLAYGPEDVITQIAFVKVVPTEMQGRMYALMGVVMAIAGVVGTALVGPLSDNLGPTLTMTLAGVIFIGSTLLCFATGKAGRVLRAIEVADAG